MHEAGDSRAAAIAGPLSIGWCAWGLQCLQALHRGVPVIYATVLVSRFLRLWLAAQNFCICDPNLPDNPIVFASDGFLEMSQFDRYEVLGRNCRFLQVQFALLWPSSRAACPPVNILDLVSLIILYPKGQVIVLIAAAADST